MLSGYHGLERHIVASTAEGINSGYPRAITVNQLEVRAVKVMCHCPSSVSNLYRCPVLELAARRTTYSFTFNVIRVDRFVWNDGPLALEWWTDGFWRGCLFAMEYSRLWRAW